jgi:hypothetical protein
MLTYAKDGLYLVSLLKLILTFTKDSEKFSKAVSQYNNYALVKNFLLQVFDGTGFTSIEFPLEVLKYSVHVMRRLLKYDHKVRTIIFDEKE